MAEQHEQLNDDAILLEEIARNEKIVVHPHFGAIRLRRPTPKIERQISEVRGKEYHRALRDPDVLSRAQLEKIARDRGMWSNEQQERLEQLQTRVGELMGVLMIIGYDTPETLSNKFYGAYERLEELFKDDEEALAALGRYFDLNLERGEAADYKILMTRAGSTEVDDLLHEGDECRTEIRVLKQFSEARQELEQLRAEHTNLVKDSVEARAEQSERLAHIYFCTSNAETGKPLWPTIDDLWDAVPSHVEFLLSEIFYFSHGISDLQRGLLEKHAFMPRVRDSEEQSDDSPAHPTPKSGGESQAAASEISLVSTPATS